MRGSGVVKSAAALVKHNASSQVTRAGIKMVALPATGHTPMLSISFKAGSVNETIDNLGASAIARNALGNSSHQNSGMLFNKMLSAVGGKFSTDGTRERTVMNIVAGPKVIEGILLKAVLPAILEPMFFKWEMTPAWYSAMNQQECPLMEAFHQASFKGGLANPLSFKGGYASDDWALYEIRDEEMEQLAMKWHRAQYGPEDAIVVGANIPEDLLNHFVKSLDESCPWKNAPAQSSSFRAGEITNLRRGPSSAVVGLDATNVDPNVAATLAEAIGGSFCSYSDAAAIAVAATSPAELGAKLDLLAGLSADAAANANQQVKLNEALKLNGGDAAALATVATDSAVLSGECDVDEVLQVAATLAGSKKSLVVMGDVNSFPSQAQI